MEVSKFPRKTWGAAHAQTVCTRRSLRFFKRLGTRLTDAIETTCGWRVLQCSVEEGLLAIIGSKSWSLLVNCQHEYSPTKPWTDKKWTGSSCYCAQSSVNESQKSQLNISRSVRGSTHSSCTCTRQGWLEVNLKALKTITAWLSYPAGNQYQLLFL